MTDEQEAAAVVERISTEMEVRVDEKQFALAQQDLPFTTTNGIIFRIINRSEWLAGSSSHHWIAQRVGIDLRNREHLYVLTRGRIG